MLSIFSDWFQIGKGVCQGCILSPCLFNLYAEYIMKNAGLEETQAGMKIARRNSKCCRGCGEKENPPRLFVGMSTCTLEIMEVP